MTCFLSVALASNEMERKYEIYLQSKTHSRSIAKVLCVDAIQSNLIEENWRSPLRIYRALRAFQSQSADYLGPLKTFSPQNYENMTIYERSLLSDGRLIYHTFGHSLRHSVVSLLGGEMEELMRLRTFYIEQIFQGKEFAAEVTACASYFNRSPDDLLENLRSKALMADRGGYISGTALGLLGGGLIIRGLIHLPRYVNYFLLGGAVVGTGYIGYSMTNASFDRIRSTADTGKHHEETTTFMLNPADHWPYVYNLCLKVRDANKEHLLVNTQESFENLSQALTNLAEYKSFLIHAETAFESHQNHLSPMQSAQHKLILLVLRLLP
jgi:hypothetical protein